MILNDNIISFSYPNFSGSDVTKYHFKSFYHIKFGHNYGHNYGKYFLFSDYNYATR
jgi:hypothetical protein